MRHIEDFHRIPRRLLHDPGMMAVQPSIITAVMSHECHSVSNHRQLHCLFNKYFKTATKRTKSPALNHWWSVVIGRPKYRFLYYRIYDSNHWWRHEMELFRITSPLGDSSHKEPVISGNVDLWWCISCCLNNCLTNSCRVTGELRHHDDVAIMHNFLYMQQWHRYGP